MIQWWWFFCFCFFFFFRLYSIIDLGGASGKEPICQCRTHKRHKLDPWVGTIPWRRAWQPTPVFLPGESHGQRSLAGCSPWGCKESDTTERLHFSPNYLQHARPCSAWHVWTHLTLTNPSKQQLLLSPLQQQRRQWHPLQYSCLENPMDGEPVFRGYLDGPGYFLLWNTFHYYGLEYLGGRQALG